MSERVCLFCDSDATRLCDGILSHPRDDFGYIITDADAETCDGPLCDLHANAVGHTCGPDGCETLDLCPPCAAKHTGARLEEA